MTPDPARRCEAENSGSRCAREAGHDGPHDAGFSWSTDNIVKITPEHIYGERRRDMRKGKKGGGKKKC